MRKARSLSIVALLACVVAGIGCDRNIEPFDPDEQPSEPDLSKIFPAGQAPDDERPMARMPAGAGSGTRGTASAGAAPASTSAAAIVGTVRLADELGGRAPAGGVLFVIARPSGAVGGPPLAVQRIAAADLPTEFSIGPENVMIPTMKFEGQIQLTARFDADGNAMTREPGDLQGAAVAAVEPGSTGVDIVLDELL